MVVHRRRRVLLLRREDRHRALEVLLDDARRAAELAERCELETTGSAFALDVPQSLEHELEIWRLDPSAFGGGILGAASARRSELDPTCLDGVEDLIDELVVRDYRLCLAGKLVVPLDRPEDRPLAA